MDHNLADQALKKKLAGTQLPLLIRGGKDHRWHPVSKFFLGLRHRGVAAELSKLSKNSRKKTVFQPGGHAAEKGRARTVKKGKISITPKSEGLGAQCKVGEVV